MELRKTEHGEIITEAGFYDIPIDWYHDQCCDGPSISSSGVRTLLKSPAEYWKFSKLNPNREPEPDKEAYVLGRATHHLVLGEADFGKQFVARPEKLLGEKWHGNKTICKDWLAARKAEGLSVLSPNQIEKIKGMSGFLPWQKGMTNCGLANTPLVSHGGVLSGQIECSFVWKVGNIWLKARPDAIPDSDDDYSDLKTTGTGIDDRSLGNTNNDRGYFIQGALVGMGASAVLQRIMQGFHLVFVDTGDVHAVSIKTLSEEDIILGERAIFVAISMFEKCLSTGIWPGPTAHQTDAQRLSLPQWGRERLERNLDLLEVEYSQ